MYDKTHSGLRKEKSSVGLHSSGSDRHLLGAGAATVASISGRSPNDDNDDDDAFAAASAAASPSCSAGNWCEVVHSEKCLVEIIDYNSD